MVMVILSKPLDPAAYARLVDAWSDGEVTIGTITTRFHLSAKDMEELKRALGPKVKPSPTSPWWRQDRARRLRRGWA